MVATHVILGVAVPTPAHAWQTSSILLPPFPVDQTWYICQGYNGEISHQGAAALDLSFASDSAGPNGCTPATADASANKPVTAPGSGRTVRSDYFPDADFVCIDLDRGGSVAVGHIGDHVGI